MRWYYLFVALLSVCHGWKIDLYPDENFIIHMGDTVHIFYNLTDDNLEKPSNNVPKIRVKNTDEEVVNVALLREPSNNSSSGEFTLYGSFLGISTINIFIDDHLNHTFEVRVIRRVRTIDKIFTASVAILVSLVYINFGCVVDLNKIYKIVRRPVGPCIGLLGQFLAMPLLSYASGLIFFPERADMRLGLLFTGVSPAGGASNIWTCVLDGNIDMSVAMTTISTFAAFGLMPMWLFTLGPHVFEKAKVVVPYGHIVSLAGSLVIPLAIGCALRRWAPKVANPLARCIKGLSGVIIVFIIIFASVTNSHLFLLFTWEIAVACLSLPVMGYIFGWIVARWIVRTSLEDTIAIAIEIGVQNTGIAIFLLRFGLPQPQADLTTIVPVAVAVMTPLPLLCLWAVKKMGFLGDKTKKKLAQLECPPTSGDETDFGR